MAEARFFSARLMASQLAITAEESTASTSPNTWGWRATSLSWTRRATSARVKAPRSAASRE